MTHAPTIGKHMTPIAHSVGHDQPLDTAHRLMRENHFRHLPVLSGNQLVGIVSERDLHLAETLKGVDSRVVAVEEVMTAAPYTADESTPLAEVARVMADRKYGAALVLRRGKVVGIFTTTDVARLLAETLEALQAEAAPGGG